MMTDTMMPESGTGTEPESTGSFAQAEAVKTAIDSGNAGPAAEIRPPAEPVIQATSPTVEAARANIEQSTPAPSATTETAVIAPTPAKAEPEPKNFVAKLFHRFTNLNRH